MRNLLPRQTQINQAETLAMTLLPYNEPEVVKNRDLSSYIDYQGAMEALIKGYSSGRDTAAIACVFHLMAAKLAMRVFFERVFSDSNIVAA